MSGTSQFTGVVKWFNVNKGYGFIKRDGGSDVFLHMREVKNSGVEGGLDEGDEIRFDVHEGERGPIAVSISRL